MFAVIQTGGKQYKVSPGDKFRIEKIEGEKGSTVIFKDILAVADGENITIGKPIVENAVATCRIVRTAKDRKIIVFKKKRRKGYKRKRGHRQFFTEVLVEEIKIGNKKLVATPEEKPAAKEAPKPKVRSTLVSKAEKPAQKQVSKPKTKSASVKAVEKPAAKAAIKTEQETKPDSMKAKEETIKKEIKKKAPEKATKAGKAPQKISAKTTAVKPATDKAASPKKKSSTDKK